MPEPMRVLHVIPGLSPRDGGPTTALHRMARATAARGLQVTVVTSDDDAGGRMAVPLGVPLSTSGVDYWYFARTLGGSWKPSWGLAKWISQNVTRFDVVHVHALFSFATIPGCRLAFRAGVPVVLRPLGTASAWSLRHHGWKKRPYYALIEREHLRRAAAIHTTSEAEQEGVAALGFGERAVVIPLGIDVDQAVSPRRSVSDVFRVLFLSRLHEVKNIPLLLESVADLRATGARVRLTIAGEGAREYRGVLERKVAELELGDAVEFVGHVSGDAKRELLARADAYVLPSRHESFGIAVAEAMAAGVPVIVSDRVGIADDIRGAGAGLVVRLDRAALTSALASLASNAPARLEMGQRGIELARHRYSWDEVSRRIVELYRSVTDVRKSA